MSDLYLKISNSVEYIQKEIKGKKPKIGLILGSGLGILAEEISNRKNIKYSDIPNFPVSTVVGHASQLVIGELEGIDVIACQGRFHFYEGYKMDEVTYAIRVMEKMGVEKIIITNAAGGINKSFSPGDLMLIEDHINLMGTNPLIGENKDEFGPRFPDLSEAYSKDLRLKAIESAEKIGISLKQGIYVGVTGPSYETPAEIRYLRTIGADAVGMSTVPEVIVANHAGMQVLGISCITNMAAGVLDKKLDHTEVMETAEKVKIIFANLLKQIIPNL